MASSTEGGAPSLLTPRPARVRPSSRAVSVTFAAIAVALPASARADGPQDLEALLDEPLVETASKSTESVSAAPATTTIITAEDLRRYGVRSLDEAINYLSVGMEAETPLTAAEVGSRGVLITQDYGSHVLVLIDGHAVNEAWGGTAYFERGAGIPLEVVDHIEVILGPGSVLYGSNAMLGVINVVTKRARDYHGVHFTTEGELIPSSDGTQGFSLRGGAGFAIDFDVLKQRSELVFQGEYYSFDGPALRFDQENYGDDSVTGMPRKFSDQTPPGIWGGIASNAYWARVPSGILKFVIGDFQLKMRAALYDRSFPYHGGDFDDPTNSELDRWLSLDASYHHAVSSHVDLGARLYGDLYDYQQFYPSTAPEDCLEGQDRGCLYYLKGIGRWSGLELNGTFDWMGDGRMSTLVGADGRVKGVEARIDISDLETGVSPGLVNPYDRLEFALGVYVQQTMNPVKWLGFNVGARLDADQRYGAHVSPRAAATVSPWKGASFKLIYSSAFRAPTAFETYYADPTSQVAPTSLRPESEKSIEGSFEQRFGTHRIEFGIFHDAWEDLVINADLSADEVATAIAAGQLDPNVTSAQQTQNISSIDSFGFLGRIEGSAAGGKLRYAGSIAAARARRIEPDAPPTMLTSAAQLYGNARVSYDFEDGKPTLALASYVLGPRPTSGVDANGNVLFAPPQVELRGTISGPIKPLKGLSYRVSGSYAFAPRFAYTAGPTQLPDGSTQLAPVPQLKLALGLGYDFDWSAAHKK